VPKFIGKVNDANDIPSFRSAYCAGTNAPTNYCYIFNLGAYGNDGAQISVGFDSNLSIHLHVRGKWNGSWKAWSEK
jgi:hypothetical protein